MNLWPGTVTITGKQTEAVLDNGSRMISDVPTGDGDMDMQVHFEADGDADGVIAKLPGIVHDLRGKELLLGAKASKVHVFSEGQSLLYR